MAISPEFQISSQVLMTSFWEQNICSFKLRHGTSSIYKRHFQTYGLTAVYPPQMHDFIMNIRDLWTRHQKDIKQKTGYFCWFEERYDKSRKKGETNFSFSGNPEITKEYTTGARQGGEWIRELRQFLAAAKEKEKRLNEKERDLLLQLEEFIKLIDGSAPMSVVIHGGSPAMRKLIGMRPDAFQYLRPFEVFAAKVKENCPEWEDPLELELFFSMLEYDLNEIKKNYNMIEGGQVMGLYSEVLHHAVKPSDIAFEMGHVPQKEAEPEPPADLPVIPFDKTQKMVGDEIAKYVIGREGFSAHAFYNDSKFDVKFVCKDIHHPYFLVTRRKVKGKEFQGVEAQKARREAIRAEWKKIFQL